MEVKEGRRFYCSVCGSEILVTKGADNQIAPYTCCGMDMIEMK